MLSALLQDLEKLVAELPFHLNDTDLVNTTFRRWYANERQHDRYIIDVWTYCFVRRYFIVKFVSAPWHGDVADLDVLVEKVYKRIEAHQGELVDEARYAQWVSVICKNTYLNFLRRELAFVSVDQEMGPVLEADVEPASHDIGIVADGLQRAIDRLPDYLRDIARLRLLENGSYPEIADYTGKELDTIRAYYHKAIVKIRSDEVFLAFIGRSEPK